MYNRELLLQPPFVREYTDVTEARSTAIGDVRRGRSGQLLKAMIQYRGFTSDLIASYDNWINGSLNRQITSQAIMLSGGRYVAFTGTSVHKPTYIDNNGVERKLYPSTARALSKNYSIDIYATLKEFGPDGSVISPKQGEPDIKVYVCSIPLMLGSSRCYMNGLSDKEKLEVGECPHDPFGYFLIGSGGEKLLLFREQLRPAMPLIFMSKKGEMVCRITSSTMTGTTIVDMGLDNTTKSINIYLYYLGDRKEKAGGICVLQAMRILYELHTGEKFTGSSDALVEDILRFTEPEWREKVSRRLYMSKVFTDNTVDDVEYILRTRGEKPNRPTPEKIMEKIKLVTAKLDSIRNMTNNECGDDMTERTRNAMIDKYEKELKKLEYELENAGPSVYMGIYNDLFAHITTTVDPSEYNTPEEFERLSIRASAIKKYDLLCVMAARYAEFLANLRPPDDRNNWARKQLTPAGKTLEKRFWLLWKSIVIDYIRKEVDDGTGNINTVKRLIRPGVLTNKIRVSFTSNEWSIRKGKEHGGESVSVEVERNSQIALISHMMKINTPTNRRAKQKAIRMVQPNQVGFVDMSESADGDQCGLVKHKAIGCYVSEDRPPSIFLVVLSGMPKNVCDVTLSISKENTVAVLHDGSVVGWCNGKPTYDYLKKKKRNGGLPFDTCLVLESRILYVYTNAGRPTRPLLVVDNDGILVIEKRDAWGEPFNHLLNTGAIEYLDPWEQNSVVIAQRIEDVEPEERVDFETKISDLKLDLERVKNGDRVVRQVKEVIDGFEMVKNITLTELQLSKEIQAAESAMSREVYKYDYCELDPNAILGVSASLTPLLNHNPGPRNSYQCHMVKQALGIPHSNQHLRYDTNAGELLAPRAPLFSTQAHEFTGMDDMPAGDTVTIAIMPLMGYNQEDAIIINEAAVKRGLFRYSMSKKYAASLTETRNNSAKVTEVFGIPPPRRGHPPKAYSHLNDNGMPKVGADLALGYCIMGKIRIIEYLNGTVKKEDASLYVERGGEGVVDRVIPPTTLENAETVAKVIIRSIMSPIKGDKFASRYAQKGVIGRIMPQEDMPFGLDGASPDIVINPHCIPSRMTLGKLIEIASSKITTRTGKIMDATAFRNFDVDEMRRSLRSLGYMDGGKEVMHSGITGKMYKVPIMRGLVYYQLLTHFARSKIAARGIGPSDAITRQPVRGRRNLGGTKLGEMERDALIAHGVSSLLRERMCLSSDQFDAVFCSTCGDIATSTVETVAGSKITSNSCRVCKDKASFTRVTLPFALKALKQILHGMLLKMTFVLEEETAEESVDRIRSELGLPTK